MQVRLLSVQTETPEGGVVVRGGARISGMLVKVNKAAEGGSSYVQRRKKLDERNE